MPHHHNHGNNQNSQGCSNFLFGGADKDEQIKILAQLLQESEKKLQWYEKTIQGYIKRIGKLEKDLRSAKENKLNTVKLKLSSAVDKLYNKDQQDVLVRGTSKGSRWEDDTIVKSLRLNFSCGSSGYQELRNQGHPYPSQRTIRKRIQHIQLKEGIFDDMFDLMELKIQSFGENENFCDCILAFDEIALEPGQRWDPASKSFVGKSSFPNRANQFVDADHGMTFCLAGIQERWKQVVGNYFTPSSMDGGLLKPVIDSIIQKAESIGLRVHVVISDMGPTNQALWKAYKVCIAGRYSEIVNSIPHPSDPENRRLWFSADTGHLLKNLKSCLINNETIAVTPDFMATNNLSSSFVELSHLKDLSSFQKDLDFKLVKSLSDGVFDSNHFSKMKVSTAKQFLSRDMSAALQFMAEVTEREEMMSSSVFVNYVAKWFTIMTSRYSGVALGFTPGNEFSKQKFAETVAFLEEVIDLFQNMRVGDEGVFKPVQRGVLIATRTYIELSMYLINQKGYRFVLGARLTTDCVENIYSALRVKHPILTALQMMQDLRAVAISKYMKSVKTSSYDADGREYLSIDLSKWKKSVESKKQQVDFSSIPDLSMNPFYFHEIELYVSYQIAGYIISRVAKSNIHCKVCLRSAGSDSCIPYQFAKLTQLKCYTEHTLFFVNEETHNFFLKMEFVFRQYLPYFQDQVAHKHYDLEAFFYEKFEPIDCDLIDECHQLKYKVIKRYIRFKLNVSNYAKQVEEKAFNSKTVARHHAVK